jgi:hypothetical protein
MRWRWVSHQGCRWRRNCCRSRSDRRCHRRGVPARRLAITSRQSRPSASASRTQARTAASARGCRSAPSRATGCRPGRGPGLGHAVRLRHLAAPRHQVNAAPVPAVAQLDDQVHRGQAAAHQQHAGIGRGPVGRAAPGVGPEARGLPVPPAPGTGPAAADGRWPAAPGRPAPPGHRRFQPPTVVAALQARRPGSPSAPARPAPVRPPGPGPRWRRGSRPSSAAARSRPPRGSALGCQPAGEAALIDRVPAQAAGRHVEQVAVATGAIGQASPGWASCPSTHSVAPAGSSRISCSAVATPLNPVPTTAIASSAPHCIDKLL